MGVGQGATLQERTRTKSARVHEVFSPFHGGLLPLEQRNGLSGLQRTPPSFKGTAFLISTPSAWPSVIPLGKSALTNAPSLRLAGNCPLTVFTGLPQDSALLFFKRSIKGTIKVHDIKEDRARQVMDLEAVQASLNSMHKEVQVSSKEKRKAAVDSNIRKTGVQPMNLDVGDFVLRGVLQR